MHTGELWGFLQRNELGTDVWSKKPQAYPQKTFDC